MKFLYAIVVAVLMTACSTHQVRCHGTLRPINRPAVTSKPPGSTHSVGPGVSGSVRARGAGEPRP
jgi:hypothetical protein